MLVFFILGPSRTAGVAGATPCNAVAVFQARKSARPFGYRLGLRPVGRPLRVAKALAQPPERWELVPVRADRARQGEGPSEQRASGRSDRMAFYR